MRQRLRQGADRKSRRRWLPAVIGGAAAAAVAAVVLLYPPSLSVKAENLMKGIQPAAAAGEPLSDDFKAAVADFSLRLAAAQGLSLIHIFRIVPRWEPNRASSPDPP